jgi:hypothetical protein
VRGWLSLLAAPGDAAHARGGPPGRLTVRRPGRPQLRLADAMRIAWASCVRRPVDRGLAGRPQDGKHFLDYLLHVGHRARAIDHEVESGEAEAEEIPQLAHHLPGRTGDRIGLRLGIWIDVRGGLPSMMGRAGVIWGP